MSDFNLDLFEVRSLVAVTKGMRVVRAYQLQLKDIGEAAIKSTDATFLTAADGECGQVLLEHVRRDFPDVRWNIEDVGDSALASRIIIYGDPVDGTLPFTVGLPTSTVILGAYDTETKQVISCCIGEPASGKIYYTSNGTSRLVLLNFTTDELSNDGPIHVWSGNLSANTAVLLDHPQGFKRSRRQILTNPQSVNLLGQLAKYRLLMCGSNGLHQAVLAQGQDKMAGTITTAIGGPQDVCGVLLVLNAGGAARAFRMDEAERTLIEVSPLAIEDYDILVLGNNRDTVDSLLVDLHLALR